MRARDIYEPLEDPCEDRLNGIDSEVAEYGWCPSCDDEFVATDSQLFCPQCKITPMRWIP